MIGTEENVRADSGTDGEIIVDWGAEEGVDGKGNEIIDEEEVGIIDNSISSFEL